MYVCALLLILSTHRYPRSLALTPEFLDQAGDVYSAKGLIVVFDVFGFTNQTFRIADGLALSLNALILMPDLFDNEPLPLSIYPPDTDQKEKTMRDFFRGKANVNAGMQKLATVVNDAQVMFVHTERWGIYGFGWGGKVRLCLTRGGFQPRYIIQGY